MRPRALHCHSGETMPQSPVKMTAAQAKKLFYIEIIPPPLSAEMSDPAPHDVQAPLAAAPVAHAEVTPPVAPDPRLKRLRTHPPRLTSQHQLHADPLAGSGPKRSSHRPRLFRRFAYRHPALRRRERAAKRAKDSPRTISRWDDGSKAKVRKIPAVPCPNRMRRRSCMGTYPPPLHAMPCGGAPCRPPHCASFDARIGCAKRG